MDWVGRVALAHESVVEHFARRADATVIPMKLFTMFSSVERAVADIAARKGSIAAAMRRIAGAEEWGVRILRAPAAPAPGASGTRAASGAAFLAAKKKARDEAKLSRLAAAEAAADVFDELVTIARDARRREDAPRGWRHAAAARRCVPGARHQPKPVQECRNAAPPRDVPAPAHR